MKVAELRQKSGQDLKSLLQEKLVKLAGLRFDLAGGKTKNLKEIRQIKLDIARIKTLQKETKEQSPAVLTKDGARLTEKNKS